MSTPFKHFRLALALAACLFGAAANSRAQGPYFQLTDGFVGNINPAGYADFSLTFNLAPDFFTVDQFGRQANSFQFYISTNPTIPFLYAGRPYASLIRGGEIYLNSDLPVRNDGPPYNPADPGPTSGGWGSVRTTVPYVLAGNTLSFSVAYADLGVTGPFSYTLIVGGADTPTWSYMGSSGGVIPLPEPTAFSLAALSVATVAYVRRRKRCRP